MLQDSDLHKNIAENKGEYENTTQVLEESHTLMMLSKARLINGGPQGVTTPNRSEKEQNFEEF